MTQRPQLVLASYLLCACGQVSSLGTGVDSTNHGGTSSFGGYGERGGYGGYDAGARPGSASAGRDSAMGGSNAGAPPASGSGGNAPSLGGSGPGPSDPCTSDGARCWNNQLYVCKTIGKSPALIVPCTSGSVCDASANACVACKRDSCLPVICDPGAVTCVGRQVSRCNDSGTSWLPASDCPAGELCSNGSCNQDSCQPALWYCRDGDAYQCTAQGKFGEPYQSCDKDNERCLEKDENFYAYCAPGCVPGVKMCVDSYNMTGVCNADGSRPTTGTLCARDELCKKGVCVHRDCETYCQGGVPYSCDTKQPLQECNAGHTCLDLVPGSFTANVQCAALPCTPGAATCLRNQVGTCAADGSSLSELTADCTADGSVCTAQAQCAKTVTDTLGIAEMSEVQFDAQQFVANVITVHSPRKLTELQTWLTFLGARELRWVVAQQVNSAFVTVAEKVVSSAAVNGVFVSSGVGSFSYQLEAGKTYLVGLVVMGGDSVTTYDYEPYVENFSFGVIRGRTVLQYSPSIDIKTTIDGDDYQYIQQQASAVMKVTTEAP